MPFYPAIKEETVMTMSIVTQSLERDPNYLDNAECPFSDTVKTFFRGLKKPMGQDEVEDLFQGEDDVQVLDDQIQKVINQLEAMGPQMMTADPADRLNYYKTKTSLLEKLISMKERVFNLKEVADFRNTIMLELERICTKDQITSFMRSLDGTLGLEPQ